MPRRHPGRAADGGDDAGPEGRAAVRHGQPDYIGKILGNPSLCIPDVNLEDGPAGVGDGLGGVTQMPDGMVSAATFDTNYEQDYGAADRPGVRRQGGERGTRPDGQHGARPALGPLVRDVRRRPVPVRADGHGRRPGHPEPGRDGRGQARRRVQHRAAGRHDRRRPRTSAGDLPARRSRRRSSRAARPR